MDLYQGKKFTFPVHTNLSGVNLGCFRFQENVPGPFSLKGVLASGTEGVPFGRNIS